MHFVRLSSTLAINSDQVLHSRENGNGSVGLTFAGPGPENLHALELKGEEAQAWRDYLQAAIQERSA